MSEHKNTQCIQILVELSLVLQTHLIWSTARVRSVATGKRSYQNTHIMLADVEMHHGI